MIRAALGDERGLDEQTLALLFAADRLDHVARELSPALERGAFIICDRYLLSSLAYQASSLPLSFVREINARARRPDASVLLRVSPKTAAKRRARRGGKPERFDDDERQRRIAAAYEQALALADVGPAYVIDGEGTPDEVAKDLMSLVASFIAA